LGLDEHIGSVVGCKAVIAPAAERRLSAKLFAKPEGARERHACRHARVSGDPAAVSALFDFGRWTLRGVA
jgi:hypothetical protein